MRLKILLALLALSLVFKFYMWWEDDYWWVDLSDPFEQQFRDNERISSLARIANAIEDYQADFWKSPWFIDRWSCVSSSSQVWKDLAWNWYLKRIPKDPLDSSNKYLCWKKETGHFYYYNFLHEATDYTVLCANVEYKQNANQDAANLISKINDIKGAIRRWDEWISFRHMKDEDEIESLDDQPYYLYCIIRPEN